MQSWVKRIAVWGTGLVFLSIMMFWGTAWDGPSGIGVDNRGVALAQDTGIPNLPTTDTGASSQSINLSIAGNPCNKLEGKICTITVGDTLTLNATASITPASEQVKLTISSSPSHADLSFDGTNIGSVTAQLNFKPTEPADSIHVTFTTTSVSLPSLTNSVSTTIRVIKKGEAVPSTTTQTNPSGQTPKIELPPLKIGTVQTFIVILTDCNTHTTLSRTKSTFTPTVDESSGEITTMAIEVTGFETRILTMLIKQEFKITIPGTGAIPIPIEIVTLVFTASDGGELISIPIPELGTVSIGTICLIPAEPDIEVTPSAPDQLDFGAIPLGTRSGPQTFVIKNVGTAPLVVESVQLGKRDGVFELEQGRTLTPFTLEPGAGVSLSVTFAPSSDSTFSDNVRIQSKDPDEPTVFVPLRGFGNRHFPPPPYRITGCKYWDMNRNQSWDDFEPGLNFWSIHLDGAESATTITDITGCFMFMVNTPGTYTIREEMWLDWEPITPPSVTISVPQEVETPVLFGNDVDP